VGSTKLPEPSLVSALPEVSAAPPSSFFSESSQPVAARESETARRRSESESDERENFGMRIDPD
jgi:hypothetical protein